MGGFAVRKLDEIPGVDCPAGTVVAIPDPEVERSAIAVEPGSAVLVIGATAGRPYEVSSWDAKWTTGLPQA